jgi:ABC-type multidrug transport system ATPase subunit
VTPGLVLDRLRVQVGEAEVLADAALAAPPGSVVAILGDSGSGKTSVLATIAGRRAPAGGRVLLDGESVDPREVGYADQDHDLPDGLTAAEQLAVPLLARGTRLKDWTAIEALLAELGLPESAFHNRLEQLSGGQQQRVAVARAMVGAPRLVCLDDPTSELDGSTAELVWGVVERITSAGAVAVVTTQREDEVARATLVLRLARA